MNIKDRVILDGSMTPKLPPKTLIRLTAKATTGTILFGGYANLLFIKKGGNLI